MRSKVALITNHQTALGFEMAGLVDHPESKTIFKFEENISKDVILETFFSLVKREDVGIIFISSFFASMIDKEIQGFNELLPSVFIIPTRR